MKTSWDETGVLPTGTKYSTVPYRVKYWVFVSLPIKSLTDDKVEMGKTDRMTKGDVWTVISPFRYIIRMYTVHIIFEKVRRELPRVDSGRLGTVRHQLNLYQFEVSGATLSAICPGICPTICPWPGFRPFCPG